MNQKKKVSTIVIGMMLASVAIAISPTIAAAGLTDYDVVGQTYVDSVATDGVEVTLSVPGHNPATNTSYYKAIHGLHGLYIIHFNATMGDVGDFTVRVGYNYFVPSPPTLEISHSPHHSYNDVHLSVDTWTTNQPNKPVLVAPSDSKEFGSGTSSVTLKVDVSDPDGDWMDVYFYDAGDDGLIGTAIGIPDGGTAQVEWSGLTDDTTYNWYAVANDSIKESESSDTWSFTIEKESSDPPYNPPPPPPLPPTGGDDDEGEEDEEPTPNNPPLAPTVNGSIIGTKETNYTYSALSTDADGHNIDYIFDWGDGTNSSSGYVANNTMVNETHQWAAAGVYQIWVQAFDDYPAEDNGTPSGKTYLYVLIDAWWVKDIGYLLDEDGDGTYETFYSNETGDSTDTEYNATAGHYLLNEDGDGAWDWTYDPVTDTLSEYSEGDVPGPGDEEPEQPADDDATMWYLLGIGMIVVIAVIIGIYLVTKKKETPKKPKK